MRTLLLLALSAPALAAPTTFSHQGRVLDSAGVPLDGGKSVVFTLYDDASSGNDLWSETVTVDFASGYFHVMLGEDTALDPDDFDGSTRYLGMAIDGGAELTPRIGLVSVPYALRADTATNVLGGTVDVSEIMINGATVIDSSGNVSATVDWSSIENVPGDLGTDTLAELDCGTDQIARYSGTAWVCSSDGTDAIDASAITSGIIDPDRLPTITAADVGALPVGTTAADIGALPAGTTAADIGALPADTTAADIGALAASDGVPAIGNNTSACDGSTEGLLRWTGERLEFCDGNSWAAIYGGQNGSINSPAVSCKQLQADYPGSASGAYYVDPDGSGPLSKHQTHCEMELRGGGWTRIAAVSGTRHICSYAVARGTDAQVVSGGADAWFETDWADAVMDGGEVLADAGTDDIYAFTSANAAFTWSNIADGTVGMETQTSFAVQGAWRESTYSDLANGGGCANNQGCLLGGYDGGAWSVILGIGAYDVAAFNQNATCEASGTTHRGMYSGAPDHTWGRAGFIYVR